MKIVVICGGTSSEKKNSAENAKAVCESLIRLGHEAETMNYDRDMLRRLTETPPDLVFLCVQGKYHGDGALQAILDFVQIPYTGSGTEAASIINDKILCKILFEKYGHRTAEWFSLSGHEYREGSVDLGQIGYPFVAKAPTQGASFGIGLVRGPESTDNVNTAFAFDDPILCEKFLEGKAYSVGVLEEGENLIALPCIEMKDQRIDRSDGLILLTDKFSYGVPELEDSTIREMQDTAKAVFREVGAHDYARIDFMTDIASSRPYVLEINAVPGLNPRESFLPIEAEMAGMEYDKLIEHIILNTEKRYGLC